MPGNVDGPSSAYPGAGRLDVVYGIRGMAQPRISGVGAGIRPTWEGLIIDPCPLPGMGNVDVTRTWRGKRVRVRFDAGAFAPGQPVRLSVNGIEQAGNVLIDGSDVVPAVGTDVDVRVSWGEAAGGAVGNGVGSVMVGREVRSPKAVSGSNA